MKRVQRANEVLRVADDAVDEYLAKGYDLLDDAGKKVVKSGTRASYTAAEYNVLLEENKRLKAEIAELKKAAKN